MSKKAEIRLFDFNVYNEMVKEEDEEVDSSENSSSENSDGDKKKKSYTDNRKFIIQMFGMNKKGKTYSITVKDFQPFFYIKVPDAWGEMERSSLVIFLKEKNKYYKSSIISLKYVKKNKLYGFDAGKLHNFIKITFANTTVYNKIKAYWYTKNQNFRKRRLLKKGFEYKINGKKHSLYIYEAKLPPLLRYFHIQNISPSGWISFKRGVVKLNKYQKKTTCDYEYVASYKSIVPRPDLVENIPLKICSFDIEASSSHGDFPVAKKSYRKMIGEIITYWNKNKAKILKMDTEEKETLFKNLVFAAFGYNDEEGISLVYPKEKISMREINKHLTDLLDEKKMPLGRLLKKNPIHDRFGNIVEEDMDDEDDEIKKRWHPPLPNMICLSKNIIYLLNLKFNIGDKLDILDRALETNELKVISSPFPELEGDKCTFIGSTFMRWGEEIPYYNNIIALNTCDDMKEIPNSEVIECENERDVLVNWTKLIQKENPDIIIGYNIFGFDWKFMIDRSKENNCYDDFLRLSRNKEEDCMVRNSVLKVASGTHELTYPKINGRLQLDLYNHFRKEVNLTSYKLDNVASHFIGDYIYNTEILDTEIRFYSKNLVGLKKGDYICVEILSHSTDKYGDGEKFQILDMDDKSISIKKIDIEKYVNDKNVKLRWCLAKDDVTPHEIFELTNGSSADRSKIAKYCVQDCNLVHILLNKNDVLTGMMAQSEITSVPLDFIIMRGQGIKLLSFIAKKCSEVNTLMPVIERDPYDKGGYEGAICLKPDKGLYTKESIPVVDYSSLYPSSMISENISHDSKVWTKEYDLNDNMLKVTGERNTKGEFVYDNLPGYKYVDIKYDTYEYRRKNAKSREEKIKVGYKICRYAQFPNGKKAIMPTVLTNLLYNRKRTRNFIKFKTVTMKDGQEFSGLLSETDIHYVVIDADKNKTECLKDDVVKVEDTYNDFMKNVFDARQGGLKIVANSLYGQTGAKTSSFYDKDIAASTTATGRKLLMYAKKIITECYGNVAVDTKYGNVRVNAKVIYGDTDSAFMCFYLEWMDGTPIEGEKELELSIEMGIRVGKLASKFLKPPHDLEYEKTFKPFLLLSKKRYVGMMYETNVNKCKRKSMGIVLKRRDNAPIVKDVYGGIVDILMNNKGVGKAIDFTKAFLKDIVDEKFPKSRLIITKSLRGFYKNPDSIAHKVLADRMGKRDPGNKPATGSRIPYIYIQTKGKVKLQGDKIEHPDYIDKHNIKPDYAFYITNQIKKPVQQIYCLILDKMEGFQKYKKTFKLQLNSIKRMYKNDEKKMDEKEMKLREQYVQKIIFDDSLIKAVNRKNNQSQVNHFFHK